MHSVHQMEFDLLYLHIFKDSPNLKAFRFNFGFNPYFKVKHTEVDSSFSWGANEYNWNISSVVPLDYRSFSGDQMPFTSGGGRAKLPWKAFAYLHFTYLGEIKYQTLTESWTSYYNKCLNDLSLKRFCYCNETCISLSPELWQVLALPTQLPHEMLHWCMCWLLQGTILRGLEVQTQDESSSSRQACRPMPKGAAFFHLLARAWASAPFPLPSIFL